MKVFMNKMQRDVMLLGVRDNVVVAGRGTGKSLLHAAKNLQNFQQMPRSTTAFVAPNAKRALTNTLPSMFQHWESWGYFRDVHWCVGHRPPKSLNWPHPYIEPSNWDNIISFYTGAIGHIISQDRTGTANSKDFDFIDIDEAKFIKFDRLKQEVMQANRGHDKEFGNYYAHHGLLITSDMPVSTGGSWFLNYEKSCNKEAIEVIRGLIAEVKYTEQRIAEPNPPEYLKHHIYTLRKALREIRAKTLYYGRYSSLTNVEVLGWNYIKQMKRDLPPLIFQTSVMCIPVGIMKDGFYSSMRERHKYLASDFNYLDKLDYKFDPKNTPVDSRMDADVQKDKPLFISFDYNSNINWLVCGQPDYDLRRLNVLKSFYVKFERKLPELVSDFCRYYSYLPNHDVVYYYDSTALGSNYAVNRQDFKWVICNELQKHGWKVTVKYIGRPMVQGEKYLIINQGFAGHGLVPYFNEENNADLLVSIESAGVYNGKKDKRGEKLAETEEDRLEARTDGSDAFDTLYIGCAKFPISNMILPVSSNWS